MKKPRFPLETPTDFSYTKRVYLGGEWMQASTALVVIATGIL